MDNKKPLIQSVERALSVFEAIESSDDALRSVEIAKKIRTGSNTANNLIRTLFRRGYLSQNPQGRYLLGPRCYSLGTRCDRWQDLKNTAGPVVRRIAAETGDTTLLGVESGGSLLMILSAEGSGAVITSLRQSWYNKWHTTGAGRVILAYSGIKELRQKNKDWRLDKLTDKTITSWKILEKDASKIRTRGYGICSDEAQEGVSALGVPVFSGDNKIIAAISQAFPSFYLKSGKIKLNERVKLLKSAATEIQNFLHK